MVAGRSPIWTARTSRPASGRLANWPRSANRSPGHCVRCSEQRGRPRSANGQPTSLPRSSARPCHRTTCERCGRRGVGMDRYGGGAGRATNAGEGRPRRDPNPRRRFVARSPRRAEVAKKRNADDAESESADNADKKTGLDLGLNLFCFLIRRHPRALDPGVIRVPAVAISASLHQRLAPFLVQFLDRLAVVPSRSRPHTPAKFQAG